jgi:hypothetical protein
MNVTSIPFWFLGITLFSFLTSCSTPRSYVNVAPASSLLEKKGDLNLKANVGSDFKFEEKTFDFSSAWSPIENWGIAVNQTLLLRSKTNQSFYSRFENKSIRLVNYQSLNDEVMLELATGYGWGRLLGSEYFSFREDDVFLPGVLRNPDQYKVDSNFNRLFIQSNINFHELNDPKVRYSIGFRFQRLHFYNYTFRSKNYGNFSQQLAVKTLDPWIETNGFYGRIGWNARLSYSFVFNGSEFAEVDQPHYRRLGMSAGVFLTLKKRESN